MDWNRNIFTVILPNQVTDEIEDLLSRLLDDELCDFIGRGKYAGVESVVFSIPETGR